MKKQAQPKIYRHANCIIVARPSGFDVVDPTTNVWQTFPTQRAARWSATVFSRLSAGFGHHLASDLTIANTMQRIVKQETK